MQARYGFSGAALAGRLAAAPRAQPRQQHVVDLQGEAVVTAATVLGTVAGVGLLVWARDVLSVPVLGTVFGLAMLATELLVIDSTTDPRRFRQELRWNSAYHRLGLAG